MTTFLDGLAIQFYRGIGPETQYIAPFSSMNFFIGPNNAGKSIVLNAIADHLENLANDKPLKKLSALETYRGGVTGSFSLSSGASKPGGF